MTRPGAAFVVLAALGCGSVEDGDLRAAGPPDARSDARADAADTAGSDGDASPDATDDVGAEVDAQAEADADAAPRCPPVAPADLEATFTEKRLAAGASHTCGIRDDGTVACWGGGQAGPYYGYTVPPAGTFVRVAAGDSHTCGIRTDGEVECWGAGKTYEPVGEGCALLKCGQSMPPPGQFIEITAGYDFTCGLRPDFTLECWGGTDPIEPPCGQFVQMSAYWTLCAVGADGRVECRPSLPDFRLQEVPDFEPRDEPVKQVSLDKGCACYLYATGELDCMLVSLPNWPLGAPPWVEHWSREGVTAVSCGWWHASAILEDGTLDSMGASGEPGEFSGGTFSEITCGMEFCCGLHTDGTAECWGNGAPMPPGFPAGP